MQASPLDVREQGEREVGQGFHRLGAGTWHWDEISLAVIVHYLFYFLLVIFVDDRQANALTATGLHQRFGGRSPELCNMTYSLTYPYSLTGLLSDVTISKRPYLCPHNFDEGYMDFHCLPSLLSSSSSSPSSSSSSRRLAPTYSIIPREGDEWYTVCGTPYNPSHWEYVWLITAICGTGLTVFLQALHFPRTIWDIMSDVVFQGKLPRYYKIRVVRDRVGEWEGWKDEEAGEEKGKEEEEKGKEEEEEEEEGAEIVTREGRRSGKSREKGKGKGRLGTEMKRRIRARKDERERGRRRRFKSKGREITSRVIKDGEYRLIDRRITRDGEEQFLVAWGRRGEKNRGADTSDSDLQWVGREILSVGGRSMEYGERGGLYGGRDGGSTRARIRAFKSYIFARDRLKRLPRRGEEEEEEEEDDDDDDDEEEEEEEGEEEEEEEEEEDE